MSTLHSLTLHAPPSTLHPPRSTLHPHPCQEPFSILPLEAFCNGAIAATTEEMLTAVQSGVFEEDHEAVIPGPSY